jgi:hypothetical protein
LIIFFLKHCGILQHTWHLTFNNNPVLSETRSCSSTHPFLLVKRVVPCNSNVCKIPKIDMLKWNLTMILSSGRESKEPCILHLDIRQWFVLSFTLWPLYHWPQSSWYPLDRDVLWEEVNITHSPLFYYSTVTHLACIQ